MGHKKFLIDDSFIEKWASIYEQLEKDEKKYWELIDKVKGEVSKNETIFKSTFIDILVWKSPRLRGIVKTEKFNIYEESIRRRINY